MSGPRLPLGKGGVSAALRPHFADFWAAYPKRRPNPRALAEAEFTKSVAGGTEPSDLVRAAEGYAAECRKRGVEEAFIVHAATFLRQRRWLDYLPEAAPASGAPAAPAAAAPATPQGSGAEHPAWTLLRTQLGEAEFKVWISPLQIVSWAQGDAALLAAPTRFHRDWCRQHHHVPLKAALGVRVLHIEVAGDIQP